MENQIDTGNIVFKQKFAGRGQNKRLVRNVGTAHYDMHAQPDIFSRYAGGICPVVEMWNYDWEGSGTRDLGKCPKVFNWEVPFPTTQTCDDLGITEHMNCKKFKKNYCS